MGAVGDCYENALAESFFATLACELLACELLARTALRTHAEARGALCDFIAVFSHRQRRHSALDYLSPDTFDGRLQETPVVA